MAQRPARRCKDHVRKGVSGDDEPTHTALAAVHGLDTHGAHEAGLVTGWVSSIEDRLGMRGAVLCAVLPPSSTRR